MGEAAKAAQRDAGRSRGGLLHRAAAARELGRPSPAPRQAGLRQLQPHGRRRRRDLHRRLHDDRAERHARDAEPSAGTGAARERLSVQFAHPHRQERLARRRRHRRARRHDR